MKSNKKKLSRVGGGAPASRTPSDHLVKIVLVGDADVGKTALLKCMTGESFSSMYNPTVGVDFKSKLHPLPPPPAIATTTLKLQLWDTAGNERFVALTQTYYRGASVFDLVKSDPDPEPDTYSSHAFSKLEKRFAQLKEHAPDCIVFLVGTHLDEYLELPHVKAKDADTLAERLRSQIKEMLTRWGWGDVPFYAVSSKDGENVQALENDVAHAWMERGERPAPGTTRQVRAQAVGWEVKGQPLSHLLLSTVLLDVPVEEAEKESTGGDVVKAGSVAAAFVKKYAKAGDCVQDVLVRPVGRPPRPHAAAIELPPFSNAVALQFNLTRRQPLVADVYCEMYDPETKDVARVHVSDAGQSGNSLSGTEIVGSKSTVLDKDSPRWLPINAAKQLGLKYQGHEPNWTWERFLAEKDVRAAPILCFRVVGTLADLVSECEATTTVS